MEYTGSELTKEIIGCAIAVHRTLGPGLLESVYEECLAYELTRHSIEYVRQKPIPVTYGEIKIDCGFRLDLLVRNEVIVELKAVDDIIPIHKAQLLTYLKLTGVKIGLLINFNVSVLKNGIIRLVL